LRQRIGILAYRDRALLEIERYSSTDTQSYGPVF
jgi:hypothetical protein